MFKLLHIITISDGYIMADCFDYDLIQEPFIIFIPLAQQNCHKNQTYQARLKHIDTIKYKADTKIDPLLAYCLSGDNIVLYRISDLKIRSIKQAYLTKLLNPSIQFKNPSTLKPLNKDLAKFIIFNSGEGLFSALCDQDHNPIIAYDMGNTPYHLQHNFGKFFHVNINKLKRIIISHRHYDHCNYFLRFYKQLKHCDLIINHNFLHSNSITICYILKTFKNIYLVNHEHIFKQDNLSLHLFSNQILDNDAHNNNLCLKIQDQNQAILMVADNYLDDLKPYIFSNVKFFCASHHGSKYYKQNINSIPDNTFGGQLIVNTSGKHYNHPDYIKHYQDKAWTIIYYTFNGDIIINLNGQTNIQQQDLTQVIN